MFWMTAPFWSTRISPFLGVRCEPGLTPVVPALGQAPGGAFVEDDVVGADDVVDGDDADDATVDLEADGGGLVRGEAAEAVEDAGADVVATVCGRAAAAFEAAE
jgi:hypothetical protein